MKNPVTWLVIASVGWATFMATNVTLTFYGNHLFGSAASLSGRQPKYVALIFFVPIVVVALIGLLIWFADRAQNTGTAVVAYTIAWSAIGLLAVASAFSLLAVFTPFPIYGLLLGSTLPLLIVTLVTSHAMHAAKKSQPEVQTLPTPPPPFVTAPTTALPGTPPAP